MGPGWAAACAPGCYARSSWSSAPPPFTSCCSAEADHPRLERHRAAATRYDKLAVRYEATSLWGLRRRYSALLCTGSQYHQVAQGRGVPWASS
ncbi:hypothetical protein E1286_00085 [Nonomuraea terrae]|uniref:Uncharacterized protein n=1 Tax=Nonomuraea terrae TaxID=2530383 RepID=A0A4R4ZF48_9ACTN|nr:hypothetical protein E1286_00085 [Nonomuraea terrae]